MRSAQETFVKVRGEKMGYYDFNDHFWAPHEACKQKSEIVAQQEQLSIIEKLHSWLHSLGYRKIESSEQHNELNLSKSSQVDR